MSTDEMPPAAPIEARYDASRVMFNGAAIALVTNLTDGIRESLTAEIRAAEERQNRRLESAVGAITGDVDSLEEWRKGVEDARLVRSGQLSIIQGVGQVLMRYDKVILGIGIGIAAGIAAALAGVGS